MAVGLRLVAVTPHDLCKVLFHLAGHLADDIDGAHQKLIKVAVAHQVRVVLLDRVLKHRPNLALELQVGDVEAVAEVLHTPAGQVVELIEKIYSCIS